MSVLAYSELLKRITGINERELETPFQLLNRNHTTKKRLEVLKGLAKHEPISVGKLLHSIGFPRGGGSFITMRNYFLALEKDGILERKKIKTKDIWQFSTKAEVLKRFIS